MNKKTIAVISVISVCFIIFLCCGLTYTSTPDIDKTVDAYVAAGYTHSKFESSGFSAHSFIKDDKSVIIVWFNDRKTAEKALATSSNMSNKKFSVLRGTAVATGNKDAVKIFQWL